MGLNVWTFAGNLGRDAEQKFTQDGTSVVSFSVAVKAGYGDKEVTNWPKCTMFGKRSESVLQYLVKGQLVGISGELAMREYDKKDGSGKGYSLEVRVNDLTLLGKKGDVQPQTPVSEHSEAKGNAFQPQGGSGGMDDDSEIPF